MRTKYECYKRTYTHACTRHTLVEAYKHAPSPRRAHTILYFYSRERRCNNSPGPDRVRPVRYRIYNTQHGHYVIITIALLLLLSSLRFCFFFFHYHHYVIRDIVVHRVYVGRIRN